MTPLSYAHVRTHKHTHPHQVIEVTDPELKALCGNAQFVSITYRCFKHPLIETLCEDYVSVGQNQGPG